MQDSVSYLILRKNFWFLLEVEFEAKNPSLLFLKSWQDATVFSIAARVRSFSLGVGSLSSNFKYPFPTPVVEFRLLNVCVYCIFLKAPWYMFYLLLDSKQCISTQSNLCTIGQLIFLVKCCHLAEKQPLLTAKLAQLFLSGIIETCTFWFGCLPTD